jgi:hypothetical protein
MLEKNLLQISSHVKIVLLEPSPTLGMMHAQSALPAKLRKQASHVYSVKQERQH